MSNKKKVLFTRITLGLLLALVLLFGSLTIVNQKKIGRLETQIENLKDLNESLENSDIENFVVLNFVDIDGTIKPYFVDKTLNMSIYEFLLTTKDFKDSDFITHNDKDYFLGTDEPLTYIITDVVELQGNPDYYEIGDGWQMLEVGLQDIIMDQNYTLVKSVF